MMKQEQVQNWRIELFGSLRVTSKTDSSTTFRTNRSAILLAYLACHPDSLHLRDTLGEILWPEEDPFKQRNRLRHEIFLLRQQFGQDFLLAHGRERLALTQDHTSDIQDFDHALRYAAQAEGEQRIQALKAAWELYRDDLLSNLWDDWVLAERERRREQMHTMVVLPLISLLESAGRVSEARYFRQDAYRKLSIALPETPKTPDRSSGSTFVGREKEVAQITAWRAETDVPLLTLVGMGGIGKTSLARHCLQEVLFVSMVSVTSADGFWSTLRGSLGISASSDARLDVLEALRDRHQKILILDNLEQCVEQAQACLSDIFEAVPGFRVLATSRRALQLSKEQVITIGPLSESVALPLFLHHAQRVRPEFAHGEMEIAHAIVRILEGVPLAIELAAVRALVVDAATMHRELERRLRFLISVRPRTDTRHLSLEATLLWSYDCLSPHARRTLERMAIFQGFPTLEGIRMVCTDTPPVLDALEELALQNLIQPTQQEGQVRYAMLALVREFAYERLRPRTLVLARQRHKEYFFQLVRQIGERLGHQDWHTATKILLGDRADIVALINNVVSESDLFALRELVQLLPLILSEIGAWECLDALLLAAEEHVAPAEDAPFQSRLLAIQAALYRRRGRDSEAAQAWSRRYEIALKAQLNDEAASSLQELFMQAVEDARLADAAQLLSTWRTMDVTQNDLITAALLEAKLFVASGAISQAIQSADRAYDLLRNACPIPRSQIFVTTYLTAVYRAVEHWDEAEVLAESGVSLCLEEGFLYPMAVLASDLSAVWEHRGKLHDAAGALLIGNKIHQTLRSRHAVVSARALADFRRRHRNNAELQHWLGELETRPWREIPALLAWNPAPLVHDLSTKPP